MSENTKQKVDRVDLCSDSSSPETTSLITEQPDLHTEQEKDSEEAFKQAFDQTLRTVLSKHESGNEGSG